MSWPYIRGRLSLLSTEVCPTAGLVDLPAVEGAAVTTRTIGTGEQTTTDVPLRIDFAKSENVVVDYKIQV